MRDHVVHDLLQELAQVKEENKRLKEEKEAEKHKALVRDGVYGLKNRCVIAITRLMDSKTAPIVYACGEFSFLGEENNETGNCLVGMQKCTLHDLLQARIRVNGHSSQYKPIHQWRAKYTFHYNGSHEQSSFTCWNDIPDADCSADFVLSNPDADNLQISELSFHLEDVAKDKLFEFSLGDVEELEDGVEEFVRYCRFDTIIRCLGEDAQVLFDNFG